MKKLLSTLLFIVASLPTMAQIDDLNNGINSIDPNGNITNSQKRKNSADSLGSDKEIPEGIYVWKVDRRFGDRIMAQPDTLTHMFMNSIFTTGMRGEYNTTGNLGAPRQNRIFIDRKEDNKFIFVNPYDYFVTPVEDFLFTNTLSPLTNINYNTCGNRTNGEDHLKTKFAVNAGKRIGVGFMIDYIYGRGYYSNQSTSHFNYTMYGSYLGERYQAHLLMSTNHEKVTENGGITNDYYITHPEMYNESFTNSEIPTMLERNWNRNDNQHIFFTQRYNVGFKRKVPMTAEEIKARKFAIEAAKEKKEREAKDQAMRDARDEGRDVDEKDVKVPNTYAGRPDNAKVMDKAAPRNDSTATKNNRIKVSDKATMDSLLTAEAKAKADTSWLKDEYVPVTSFIHTVEFNNYRRIYEAYETPANYYLDTYNVKERLANDSLYDRTSHWSLRNTFAISLLEGFNKWVKTGAKVFISHTLDHYNLPDSVGTRKWNEHSVTLGAQLSKTQGKTLHYNVTGEFATAGYNVGEFKIDGGLDLNFPLLGDTMTLAASGFYHHTKPSFYYRHYQSRHLWWDDDDLSMIDHFRAQGVLNYQKTRTRLRFAFDEMKNYTYFATTYTTSDEGRLYNAVASRQEGDAITLLTAEIAQDFTLGPLNWETVLTWQKSTKQSVIPVPAINVYTNLYLKFKIAHVLHCDFGADVRYFTKYTAPDYVPSLGQYAVQANSDNVKVGGYPLANVYLNFKLSKARFFVMMSHVNGGSGNKEYFFTPHYPLNTRIFRFGISWNFAN